MNSKTTGQLLIVGLGMIVGIFATVAILLNPTGGISGISQLITAIGIILGLFNPKGGLFFLVVQAVYADQMKRVGVYYGVQSTETVSEILIGPLLTICAINFSFLYGVLRRQFKIGSLGWLLYAIAPLVAGILLVKGRESGLILNIYLAGTTSLYLTLIPICYGIFNTFEDWVKFISFQIIIAAPAAAWGIWQYFNGFSPLEWSYALSGLSRVHSAQMMMKEPRIFGFFGSASAFGCVTMFGLVSLWRGLRYREGRWWFILLALLYLIVTVLSHQRTLLLFPLIVLVFTYAFRRISTTLLLYGSTAILLFFGVINSTYLRNEGIEKINAFITGESRWSQSVMNVSTFSDRLIGWERLKDPNSWTLFGTEQLLRSNMLAELGKPDYSASDYSHDIINRVLINFGAVGLFVVFTFSMIILYQLHKIIFQSNNKLHHEDGAFVMACIVPVLILSFMGGDNFSTTPINLQTWSILAGIFILKKSPYSQSPQHPNSLEPAANRSQSPSFARN